MQQNESPGKKFALGFVHLRLQTVIDISGCSYLYPTLNPLPLTVSVLSSPLSASEGLSTGTLTPQTPRTNLCLHEQRSVRKQFFEAPGIFGAEIVLMNLRECLLHKVSHSHTETRISLF